MRCCSGGVVEVGVNKEGKDDGDGDGDGDGSSERSDGNVKG